MNIEKLLKMSLSELEKYYITIGDRIEKLVVKGIILSKTNYGVIQEELF